VIGGTSNGTAANNNFLVPFAQNDAGAETQVPVPVAGTIQHLYAQISSATAAGTSWTITVRKNGANTPVTCTIASPATTCNSGALSAAFAAGDLISVQVTTANAAAARTWSWSVSLS
jgi:hypothetical protein